MAFEILGTINNATLKVLNKDGVLASVFNSILITSLILTIFILMLHSLIKDSTTFKKFLYTFLLSSVCLFLYSTLQKRTITETIMKNNPHYQVSQRTDIEMYPPIIGGTSQNLGSLQNYEMSQNYERSQNLGNQLPSLGSMQNTENNKKDCEKIEHLDISDFIE